ncbi:DNA sulfur modification protein DndD [Haladaptatus sp. W1]|uniref:DNA sulfur modification protein DndD n=1 Tax=Haladaptatus sp. W1 TaxID=1897478 RepID=UPI000849BAB0|nr:DNA sulfur modification protein DndD [Haladaptatus sp. W1]ODR83290.1 DNA sulfur modification protein DndD [Haladaptatus sp. W1]
MKLNKLIISNFGPYRGDNEFDLRTTPDKPVILFGGKNGSGKTTLFQAIQICLHGRSALGRRTSQSEYKSEIRSNLHDGTGGKSSTASVRLNFEYGNFGDRESYSVERSWRDRGESIVEDLTVKRNGNELTDLDASQWEDFLKELIPPGVSQLFFFDGEKVQELATSIEEGSGFEDSLLSLLGLDLVDRLEADLSIYLSNKLDDESGELTEKIQEFEAETEELEDELDKIEHEIAQAMDNRSELDRKISQKEETLAQEGGAFAERRNELKDERASLESEISSIEEEMRNVVMGTFPFTLAPDLCRNVEDRLREETRIRNRTVAWEEVIEELDSFATEDHINQLSNLDLSVDQSQKLISHLQAELSDKIDDEAIELQLANSFSENQRQQMFTIVDSALTQDPQRMAKLSAKYEDKTRQLQKIEQQLTRAPDEESISPILTEINELTEKRGKLSKEIEELDERREEIETEITRIETERDRVIEKQARAEDISERADLARKTRRAVKEYREKLATRKLNRLESVLTERYRTLSNKSEFYQSVNIDEDELTIWIETANRGRKEQSQLSAGERQIFATALLWALADISDRPLPFIIDTPMGRLDHDHRENLVKNFFPEASHQVLVLSTDTEITEGYYDYLSDFTAAEYHFDYDEDEGKTDITRGYFESSSSESRASSSETSEINEHDDEQIELEGFNNE